LPVTWLWLPIAWLSLRAPIIRLSTTRTRRRIAFHSREAAVGQAADHTAPAVAACPVVGQGLRIVLEEVVVQEHHIVLVEVVDRIRADLEAVLHILEEAVGRILEVAGRILEVVAGRNLVLVGELHNQAEDHIQVAQGEVRHSPADQEVGTDLAASEVAPVELHSLEEERHTPAALLAASLLEARLPPRHLVAVAQ